MILSKTSLNRWLAQQHKLIEGCTSAILVRAIADGSFQWIGSAPDDITLDPLSLQAVNDAMQKQRVVLTTAENGQPLLATPILLNQNLWGVIVLALDKKQDLRTSVKILHSGLTWLKFLLQQDRPAAPSSTTATPRDLQAQHLLQLTSKLLHDNSLGETAISLVNFVATQLQSLRVSLGLQTSQGIELTAVSFSANFDARTHAMQAICAAMDEAADQKRNLATGGPKEAETDGIILLKHEELRQTQQAASVHTFLLRKESQLIGAITLEQNDGSFSPEQGEFIQRLLDIAGDIIALKKISEANIRQQLGFRFHHTMKRWFGEKHLTRKLCGAGALLLLLALCFPANYWITSDARLISSYRYLVVSPQDGYLAAIKARPGTPVKQGDLLAQLNDEDLRLEQRKLFSQQQQAMQEYDNALANANRVQAAIANEKVAQASSQLQLIEQQQLRAQLVAPSDGIITFYDISQSLGAPVKQGQTLFEISATQGYLVQLFVDERDIAPIQAGQTGKLKLTSAPNEVFEFTVKSVTPISEIREGKNYFVVEGNLNRESPMLRPGMTGSGKILSGRKLQGWIWLHDIWYWLRLTLWL